MNMLKCFFILAVAFIWVLQPSNVLACEPVPQLLFIFIGPSNWGAAIAAQASIALFGVVFVKSILFAYKNGTNRLSSFVLMLLANVYSSLPGIVGLIIVSIPAAVLFSIPLLYFMYYSMSNFLLEGITKTKKLSAKAFVDNRGGIAAVLLGATMISTLFFFLSQSFLVRNLWLYWMAKVVFTTLAVSIGLAISISCEGAFITMLRKRVVNKEDSCFESVIWANVWGAFISVGIAAAVILPRRFESRNFLVLIEHAIRHMLS